MTQISTRIPDDLVRRIRGRPKFVRFGAREVIAVWPALAESGHQHH